MMEIKIKELFTIPAIEIIEIGANDIITDSELEKKYKDSYNFANEEDEIDWVDLD